MLALHAISTMQSCPGSWRRAACRSRHSARKRLTAVQELHQPLFQLHQSHGTGVGQACPHQALSKFVLVIPNHGVQGGVQILQGLGGGVGEAHSSGVLVGGGD